MHLGAGAKWDGQILTNLNLGVSRSVPEPKRRGREVRFFSLLLALIVLLQCTLCSCEHYAAFAHYQEAGWLRKTASKHHTISQCHTVYITKNHALTNVRR